MQIKSLLKYFVILFTLISCVNEINQPKLGKYRAEMKANDGSNLHLTLNF